MESLKNYITESLKINESEEITEKVEVIICDDENIKSVVLEEIKKFGKKANLNHLDVSKVEDMDELFKDSDFDGDISKWDVSSLKYAKGMFEDSKFNGDISKWKPKTLFWMSGMFKDSKFNGDISKWNLPINKLEQKHVKEMFIGSPLDGKEPKWYLDIVK